eukprot:2583692-Rhodomonas_salina.1
MQVARSPDEDWRHFGGPDREVEQNGLPKCPSLWESFTQEDRRRGWGSDRQGVDWERGGVKGRQSMMDSSHAVRRQSRTQM